MATNSNTSLSSQASTAPADPGTTILTHGRLRQLNITLSGSRPFTASEQRVAEHRLVLLQLKFGLSLNALSSPEMADFVRSVRSDFRVPCPRTLQRRQGELAEHTRKRVNHRLQAIKLASLSVDMWEDDT